MEVMYKSESLPNVIYNIRSADMANQKQGLVDGFGWLGIRLNRMLLTNAAIWSIENMYV